MKKPIKKKRYLMIAMVTFLSAFSVEKAGAAYPSLLEYHLNLNMSFDQCSAKANEVANLVFSEVTNSEKYDDVSRITGTTSSASGALHCFKQDRGSYFIVHTTGGYDDHFADSDRKIAQRIRSYMLGQ